MDYKLPLTEIKTPEDVAKLVSAISELADSLDVLYTESAPNSNISGRVGQIALYKNGSTYEVWICTDATTWQQVGAVSYADTRFKVGTFTRDMTLGDGNVAYTGVGFQPKAILFFGGEEGSALIYFSDGFTDGTTHKARGIYTAAGVYVIDVASCILLYEDGNTEQGATLSSFDSNGFTLTWTKTGTPSAATAYVHYLAFR